MSIKTKQNLVFWVIFIALSIHFKFYETINLAPQSTDLWRQADCYTIALNYYQNGFHFFKPQVHFLFEQNGYAAGEFPLIYFISAILFKFFGVHFFLFKGVNLLIFFTGLYALFRLSLKITNDLLFSYILSILYFCTPVIFFYANNFLSDVSALSFNIIGTLLFLTFLEENNIKKLFVAATSFAIAGLLKASASIFLIAIICALFTELFLSKTKSKEYKVIKSNQYKVLFSLIFALSLIVTWYLYAIAFNKSNHTIFFGTKAMKGWPLWENTLLDNISFMQKAKFVFFESLSFINLIIFSFSIIIIFFFYKKVDSFFIKLLLFISIGFCVFIAYFWKGFHDQQYYFVNLIILPLISTNIAHKVYLTFNPTKTFRFLYFFVLLLSLLFLINSSKNLYLCYYKSGWRVQKLDEVYYDINLENKLLRLGINKNDKVISLNDGTPNGTLSMLNRRGWSSFAFRYRNDIVFTKESFNSKIKKGATYLILNDTSLLNNEIIRAYAQSPIGNYKGLFIYKLMLQ